MTTANWALKWIMDVNLLSLRLLLFQLEFVLLIEMLGFHGNLLLAATGHRDQRTQTHKSSKFLLAPIAIGASIQTLYPSYLLLWIASYKRGIHFLHFKPLPKSRFSEGARYLVRGTLSLVSRSAMFWAEHVLYTVATGKR